MEDELEALAKEIAPLTAKYAEAEWDEETVLNALQMLQACGYSVTQTELKE